MRNISDIVIGDAINQHFLYPSSGNDGQLRLGFLLAGAGNFLSFIVGEKVPDVARGYLPDFPLYLIAELPFATREYARLILEASDRAQMIFGVNNDHLPFYPIFSVSNCQP